MTKSIFVIHGDPEVHANQVTHAANAYEITQDEKKPSQKDQPCDYRVGALDHLRWVQLSDPRW